MLLVGFFEEKVYILVKPGGHAVLRKICVKILFSSNNLFICQPIYFILTHIVA